MKRGRAGLRILVSGKPKRKEEKREIEEKDDIDLFPWLSKSKEKELIICRFPLYRSDDTYQLTPTNQPIYAQTQT